MRQLLPRKTTNNNEMTNIRNQLLRLSLSDAYNAHCQKCLHFHNRTVCNLHVSTFAHTHTHTHMAVYDRQGGPNKVSRLPIYH